MKTFDLKLYLSYAGSIIKTNTIILWCLGFIALCSSITFLLKETAFFRLLYILTTILSVSATPVIYGIYYELIEDTYSSVKNIAVTYVLKYIRLLIRMYLPIVFLAGLPLILLPESGGSGYFQITIISFSLIYMFVIPFFYLSRKQAGAIVGGVNFLLKHLSQSTPLILVVLLLETTMLILQHNKALLLQLGPLLFICIDFTIYMVASICDFMLFIILIFILKNENNTSTD